MEKQCSEVSQGERQVPACHTTGHFPLTIMLFVFFISVNARGIDPKYKNPGAGKISIVQVSDLFLI